MIQYFPTTLYIYAKIQAHYSKKGCTRLGPLKDALPNGLQFCCHKIIVYEVTNIMNNKDINYLFRLIVVTVTPKLKIIVVLLSFIIIH